MKKENKKSKVDTVKLTCKGKKGAEPKPNYSTVTAAESAATRSCLMLQSAVAYHGGMAKRVSFTRKKQVTVPLTLETLMNFLSLKVLELDRGLKKDASTDGRFENMGENTAVGDLIEFRFDVVRVKGQPYTFTVKDDIVSFDKELIRLNGNTSATALANYILDGNKLPEGIELDVTLREVEEESKKLALLNAFDSPEGAKTRRQRVTIKKHGLEVEEGEKLPDFIDPSTAGILYFNHIHGLNEDNRACTRSATKTARVMSDPKYRPFMTDYGKILSNMKSARHVMRRQAVVAAAYAWYIHDKPMFELLFTCIADGVGLIPGSPIHMLKERLDMHTPLGGSAKQKNVDSADDEDVYSWIVNGGNKALVGGNYSGKEKIPGTKGAERELPVPIKLTAEMKREVCEALKAVRAIMAKAAELV